MSWKPEIKTAHDTKWYSNELIFETKQEAESYARDLFYRWTATESWRVTEVTAPVNYRWKEGRAIPVEENP
jgi:hypothetical protein